MRKQKSASTKLDNWKVTSFKLCEESLKNMTISLLNPGQLERRGRTSLKNSEDCINTIGLLEGKKQNLNGQS